MPRSLVRLSRWATLAVLAIGAPQAVSAQDSTANHLYDKFLATLDFSTVLNNSEARVDGSAGEGTTLNFKDLLGISGSSVQPALGFAWKPGRRTELSVGYQFISQSGTRSFSDSLIIGDNTVFGQIDANTDISTDNANLGFKYAILAKEKYIAGVELGLGAIFFDLQFDGTATGCVGPDCASATAVDVKRSLTVPTGALGVFGQWRLGDHWYVGGDARGIGGKVDRYDVSIFQADLFARYFFSDRWGAGAGWYFNDVTVDIAAKSDGSSDGDLDLGGKVSFNYTSLRLGVIAAF